MGQQVLHPGAKHDYGRLRGLTPEALREVHASKKHIAMPWHKDQDDLKRDMATGKRLYSQRSLRARAGKASRELAARQAAASAAIEPPAPPTAPALPQAVAPAGPPAPAAPPQVQPPAPGMSLIPNRFGGGNYRLDQLNPGHRAAQQSIIDGLRAKRAPAPAPAMPAPAAVPAPVPADVSGLRRPALPPMGANSMPPLVRRPPLPMPGPPGIG